MTTKRKQGLLKLDGAEPMSLVESDDAPVVAWSPEQETDAANIADAVRSYVKSLESLASGKYLHFSSAIPEYMAHPGNVLIAICGDGVVIRYERKRQDDRKLAVLVMQEGIAQASAQLSQRLVHVQSPGLSSAVDENFGVEMKLTVHSPSEQKSHDLMAARIWFQVEDAPSQDRARGLARPYRLLSVRNRLDLEIAGEICAEDDSKAPNQPFLARSTMRLSAGWDCIEVFPGLDREAWKADVAPLWAENDLLGAVLVVQTQDAQLSNLDPRASARRHYASLLVEFNKLLESSPDREQTLQAFLQSNPALLCPSHVRMWPKLPLGATITDFVFQEANRDYLLVELERSTLSLFRQDGHPTADLTHAHGQIVDWKRYLEDNLSTAQRELGLAGITPNPNGLLVIGRSGSLHPTNRRKLQTMMNESPKLRIMTYDDVYETAKAVLENLLGPTWDVGGTTQIYYPRRE